MIADTSAWQFTTLPGPSQLETCELANITYHAPR